MSRPTLFVAIASYKDRQLGATVQHAIQQAQWKDRLRFGIVDQCAPADRWPTPTGTLGQQIQYLWVDPLMTRGCCFARSLAQQLYAGETIYFQTDAHMGFPLGWDEWVVETLFDRMAKGADCVVSSYPPSMKWTNEEAVIERHAPNTVIQHRLNATAAFGSRGIYLDFEATHHTRAQPMRAHHLSAAVLIAPGRFVEQFPIWDNITTFNGNHWRGSIDIVSGGFPCQDISSAGRGAGIEGKKSVLGKGKGLS